MRIRRLVLRVISEAGPFGTTIDFPDGLVILWADNSMGKSTCVKSILWALGFEAMLTTSQQDAPLPPAMKAQIDTGTETVGVIESEVLVEIENAKGDRVVVHRGVAGARNTHLVTVTHGPGLTSPQASLKQEDFFVSRPGGATREQGFHQFLAGFLGWTIPEVQTFEGRDCPLYLQCIFPYVCVEQTRGWSSLQPQVPVQFRIRDVHKRVVEFVLRLDAHEIAAKRQRLRNEESKIESEWTGLVKEAQLVSHTVNGSLQGIPAAPTAVWPPQIKPLLMVPQGSNEWVPVGDAIKADKVALDQLVEREIPRATEVTNAVTSELAEAESKLRERDTILARVLDALESEKQEVVAVELRLEALEEDLRRNKDVQTLRTLGSNLTTSLAPEECPTCHQLLKDSLTPMEQNQSVMSIDQNIKFISEQRRTFLAVLANSRKVVDARENQVAALREEVSALRSRIRALRQTLVSDGRLPSIAAIRSRLELEDRVRRVELAEENFSRVLLRFRDAASEWTRIQTDIKNLPKDDVSAEDRGKVTRLAQLFAEQLRQFGFKSLKAEEVTVSVDSYRPEHEGFDLPTNISASDFIRVIWAYLNGFLEVARSFSTNHPGLLIFDEPKQQSTKDPSFAELLKRVSAAVNFGQQVIFATSEKKENLQKLLLGVPHRYLEFEGRILKRLAQA